MNRTIKFHCDFYKKEYEVCVFLDTASWQWLRFGFDAQEVNKFVDFPEFEKSVNCEIEVEFVDDLTTVFRWEDANQEIYEVSLFQNADTYSLPYNPADKAEEVENKNNAFFFEQHEINLSCLIDNVCIEMYPQMFGDNEYANKYKVLPTLAKELTHGGLDCTEADLKEWQILNNQVPLDIMQKIAKILIKKKLI